VNQNIFVRLGLPAVDIDVGLKMYWYPDGGSNNVFGFGLSAFALKTLHEHSKLKGRAIGGLSFSRSKADINTAGDKIAISFFLGYQPELHIFDHLVITTRFGISIPMQPDFLLQTSGNSLSLTSGLSFIVLF